MSQKKHKKTMSFLSFCPKKTLPEMLSLLSFCRKNDTAGRRVYTLTPRACRYFFRYNPLRSLRKRVDSAL